MKQTRLLLFAALISLSFISCKTSPEEKKSEMDTSDFHYKLAAGYFENHEIPPAIRELTVALEKDPKNADAHYLLGFIYLGRQDYERGYYHFDQAVKSRENFFSAINNRGTALLGLEKWEEAIEDFERLIDQPLYATPELAYNNIGWAQHNLGDNVAAAASFKRAIFLKPGFCLGYNNLGTAQEALDQIDQAADSYLSAIERCGDVYAEPHFNLGKIYATQGDPRAIESFEKCIAINPESELGQRCKNYLRAIRPEE